MRRLLVSALAVGTLAAACAIPPTGIIALDDEASVAPGGQVIIPVLLNDRAPPGESLVVTNVAGGIGTLSVGDDGTVTYTAPPSFGSDDGFTYTVGSAGSPAVTASVVVSAEGGSGLTVVTAGNGSVTSQPAGIDCGAACATHFASGALVELTAEPDAGWLLRDWGDACPEPTPRCTVSLREDVTVVATFVDIDSAVPAATDDRVEVDEGGFVDIDVLANDVDPSQLPLEVVRWNDGFLGHGTLIENPDGTLRYTHDGAEPTTETFTYVISNGIQESDPATVSIVVAGVNDPPTATGDRGVVDEGGTTRIAILNNDDDLDGDALTAIIREQPAHGVVEVSSTGTVTYAHSGSETTTDRFTYVASDGAAESAETTVTIAINPINDPPVAVDDGLFTVVMAATVACVEGNVLDNDVDPDSPSLSATIVTNGRQAEATMDETGAFRYCVFAGVTDYEDSFTYEVTDGTASDEATVRILIDGPPFALPDEVDVGCSAVTISLIGTDPNFDRLTFQIVREPIEGALGPLVQTSDFVATVTYFPPSPSYVYEESFEFEVDDGVSTSRATVFIDASCIVIP